jgi:hypothetical protein
MLDETNSSLTVTNRSGSPKIYSMDFVSKDLAMNRASRLRGLSTGVGLLVLAVGFSSLGFLSLLKRHTEDAAAGLLSENTYSLIGSFLSLLVGATFLTAAVLFVGAKLRGETTPIPDRFSIASHDRCKNRQSSSPVVIDL